MRRWAVEMGRRQLCGALNFEYLTRESTRIYFMMVLIYRLHGAHPQSCVYFGLKIILLIYTS